MKHDKENDIQDFGWQKEKRKRRFKNKRKDKKRFVGNLGKLFEDRPDDDDDKYWQDEEN